MLVGKRERKLAAHGGDKGIEREGNGKHGKGRGEKDKEVMGMVRTIWRVRDGPH